MALIVRSVLGLGVILVAVACADVADPPADDAAIPTTQSTLVDSTFAAFVDEPTSSKATVTSSSSTTSTSIVTTTSPSPASDIESGLFCRDLLGRGYGYSEAVAYWTREGQPDRMDADRNGIPCETVYERAEVLAFWGDPLPTTTTPPTWYAVGYPGSGPGTLPGSGGAGGSGCSPGSDALPDGIWFVFMETATADQITFDLACTWPGKELDEGYITNDSDRLRTIDVASNATAFQVVDTPAGLGWVPMPYGEWLVAPQDPTLCSYPCDAAWLYVNNGAVTELRQEWFP